MSNSKKKKKQYTPSNYAKMQAKQAREKALEIEKSSPSRNTLAGDEREPGIIGYLTWIGLVAGFVCCIFSGGQHNIPIMSWLWPFLLLYYMRLETSKVAPELTMIAIMVATCIKYRHVMLLGTFGDITMCIVMGLVFYLPFLVDRILTWRVPNASAILVFPAAWALLEYFGTYIYGDTFGLYVTQAPWLPVIQCTSILGEYALSFIMLLPASLAVYAMEAYLGKREAYQSTLSKVALVTAVFVIAPIIYGFLMLGAVDKGDLSAEGTPVKTVRIATAVGPEAPYEDGVYHVADYETGKTHLAEDAKAAAEGGAKVICWSEEAFTMETKNEDAFIDFVKETAVENDIDMLVPYEHGKKEGGKYTNKLIYVDSNGKILCDYIKGKLVPVMESNYVEGEEFPPTFETEYGTFAAAICMDGNYPDFLRDSCITADVLFLPSWDWEAVSQQHYHETVFRATENGVAVVRATYDGVSTVYNKYGRALVESDSLKVGYDEVTFADVPIDGTVTFYNRCSGWLNWMFLVMLVVAFRSIPRRSSEGYRVR